MASVKVLVLGSPNGALKPAFSKVAFLHSKNSFSFALITGDLFGPDVDSESSTATATSLLNGEIAVPLPTYFTVGAHPLPPSIIAKIEADEEICENLHYLGKRSVTKITEGGTRIVALGGRLDREITGGTSKEQHLPFHTAHDAKTLKGAGKADILLTSVWPTGVWAGSNAVLSPENQAAVDSTREVAELCDALGPRYHFSPSAGDFFYERQPFFRPSRDTGQNADDTPVTRFISMAPFGNPAKAKAMYAFSLTLTDASAVERPLGSTASPFLSLHNEGSTKRKAAGDGSSFSRFAHGDDGGHHGRRGHKGKKRRPNASPPPGPDRCFFCLSNPNLSLHMVCAVGEDSYLATAKGPLATSTTFADQGIDFPGHIIITPTAHTPTISGSSAIPQESSSYSVDDARRTHAEMHRFREALQATVGSRSKYALGAITWEISRARNIHCHWQFHPVPSEMVRKGLVEAGFRVEAENLKYPAFEQRELSFEEERGRHEDGPDAMEVDDKSGIGDFFRLWIWADNGDDRIKGTSLVMPLPDSSDPKSPRFDLQYPRRVVAKLLGLEDRFVWQDCAQSEEEETADVEKFREAFQQWDFTQQQ